jgi:alcohol dehydrogenase
MRHLVFLGKRTLEWQETAAPALRGPNEAIVRPLAVALCDLDVWLIHGVAPFPGPFPLGHEFVAEVVEVGDAVTTVHPGHRVVVTFQVCCGQCERCARGLTGSCRVAPAGAMYGFKPLGGDWGGAIADLVRVPFAEAMCFPLPAGLAPAAVASASDNVADAWRAVGPPLAERPGANVLIVGSAMSISLYAVAIAKALGAGRVDYLAHDAAQGARAQAIGGTLVEGAPPARAGSYPITVDASMRPEGLVCALRSLEPEGICTSVSIYFSEVALPMLELYTRGVRLVTGRVNSRAVLPHVLDLVAAGRLHPEAVTTDVVPWDDAAAALASPSMKPVLTR